MWISSLDFLFGTLVGVGPRLRFGGVGPWPSLGGVGPRDSRRSRASAEIWRSRALAKSWRSRASGLEFSFMENFSRVCLGVSFSEFFFGKIFLEFVSEFRSQSLGILLHKMRTSASKQNTIHNL